MQIPIYVISLADAYERRFSITTQLKELGLSYEIIDAIDGRLSSFPLVYKNCIDENWEKKRKGEELSLSEKACALSHIKIYKKMINENIPESIILEDDAILMKDFSDFALKKFPVQAYQKLTILHLYNQQYALKNTLRLNSEYALYKPFERFLGACSYYLTLTSARSLHDIALPVWTTSDWPMAIEKELGARGLEPPIVKQSDTLDSQIQFFKNRKTPVHIIFGRLVIFPTYLFPSYFGSKWKSKYAWQALVKKVITKFIARRPINNHK